MIAGPPLRRRSCKGLPTGLRATFSKGWDGLPCREGSLTPRCVQRMRRTLIIAVLSPALWAQAVSGSQNECPTVNGQTPSTLEALANEGLRSSRLGRFDAAAACYRRALALNPRIAPIQLNLALAEFKLGHFLRAIAPLQAVLSMDPGNGQARTLLGMSYYGASRFADAAGMLGPILASDPQNARLRYVLAQSCLWSGQYDRALKEFEWLQGEQPNSAATHILTAQALDGLGHAERGDA